MGEYKGLSPSILCQYNISHSSMLNTSQSMVFPSTMNVSPRERALYSSIISQRRMPLLYIFDFFCSHSFEEGGLDIVGEDNIHRKLAAHVICVFSEPDAQNVTNSPNTLKMEPQTNRLHLPLPPPPVPRVTPFNRTAILVRTGWQQQHC
jgi:hypothetical protein